MGAAMRVVEASVNVLNKGDVDGYVAFYTENAEYTTPGGVLSGPEAIRQYFRQLAEAFPDGQVELGRSAETDTYCFVEYIYRGTHTGNLTLPNGNVYPPSGRKGSLDAVAVIRVEGDKITGQRGYWDQMDVVVQLGLTESNQ